MTRLWQAFENAPCLMEVAEVWRRQVGTEFELLRRFFSVTDVVAKRYPGAAVHHYLRVAADEHGIVAVDDETGAQNPLTPSDAVCHRVNTRALAIELCDALGIAERFEKLNSTYHTTRIGTLPARLQSHPVYLDLHGTRDGLRRAIESVARHAGRSYLLLHPTGRPITSEAESLIRLTDGCLVQLARLVDVDEQGRFITGRQPHQIFAEAIGIDFASASPRYLFKPGGNEYRMLAFDSDPVIVKESAGLWYIAQLLAHPHVPFKATELESLRTGIDARVASGSKGSLIDQQAVCEYRDRLARLDEAIEEIASLGGSLRLDELQEEREELLATLRTSIGRDGKLRENSDAEASRKNVSKAIRRAIKDVQVEHAELARHLTASIQTGRNIVYSPPSPIDWTL